MPCRSTQGEASWGSLRASQLRVALEAVSKAPGEPGPCCAGSGCTCGCRSKRGRRVEPSRKPRYWMCAGNTNWIVSNRRNSVGLSLHDKYCVSCCPLHPGCLLLATTGAPACGHHICTWFDGAFTRNSIYIYIYLFTYMYIYI